MTGSFRRAPALVLTGLLALAGSCSRPARPAADPWIAQVAAVNRQVDQLLDADDTARARQLLRTLVSAERPGAAIEDDRRLMVEDCYFRLARLALAGGDPAQALTDAETGLAYQQAAPSLFAANLLVARGAAHEALNDPRAAADDYHRALLINEALLREAAGKP